MRWLRGYGGPGSRGFEARLSLVDGYEFRGSAVDRFLAEHPEIDRGVGSGQVQAAARQWFRCLVRARDPLVVPSVAVAHLWLAMTREQERYAEFCTAATGSVVPYTPAPVTTAGEVDDPRGLLHTLLLAREDERCGPEDVPLLFRVDAEVKAANGQQYMNLCGGRAECYPLPGSICLLHLAGRARAERRSFDPRRDKPAATAPGGPTTGGFGSTRQAPGT